MQGVGEAVMNDIDEAKDWRGNDIDCNACDHRDLRAQGRCQLKRACVQDRYARRIDRFFDNNPAHADGYLHHLHFETRAIAAKHASVFLLPPLLGDPDETVRWNAAQRLPRRYLLSLRQDPHREVRIRVAAYVGTEDLRPMMEDPDYYVRLTVARRIAPSMLPQMMLDPEVEVRRVVAQRIEPRWLIHMAADDDADVRLEAAQRLAPNQLVRLRNDADWRVRYHVANQVGLTELSKMRGDADPVVEDVVQTRLTNELMGLGSDG